MDELSFSYIAGLTIRIFALLTPTAVLSSFIFHASGLPRSTRIGIACKASLSIFIIGELLFLFGPGIFSLFGFTLDAFRVGVGLLLFLSAIELMNDDGEKHMGKRGDDANISVVPLAIPLGMGPAAIGTLIVFGASSSGLEHILAGTFSLLLATMGMLVLLCMAGMVERVLGKTGIAVMAKLTALLLSALAAQVIFTGLKAFLRH